MMANAQGARAVGNSLWLGFIRDYVARAKRARGVVRHERLRAYDFNAAPRPARAFYDS